MKKTFSVVTAFAMFVSSSPLQASWLSEITGIDIDIPNSTVRINPPKPQAIPQMLQNLPKDVGQALLNPAGNALAFAIRTSRNTAGGGARPIPADIRGQLSPYFPPQILDLVRYNTNKASLSLPAIINLVNDGNTVTLDDLVVFTDSNAASDPVLWAHELTHVMQYQNMGVEGFANIYTLTGGSQLEGQARDVQNKVSQVLASNSSNSQNLNIQMAPGAFSQPLTVNNMQQQAQQFYPPSTCGTWQGIPGGALVYNSCPIPILVTSFGLMGPYGPVPVPCNFNCVVGPGLTVPFSGASTPVIGFTFMY